MWTYTLLAACLCCYSQARVLYTYENDPKDPILRNFNSTANDVTQWELEGGRRGPDGGSKRPGADVGGIMAAGGKGLAGITTREQEPLEVVVSLLQSMHEEVTNLRGQMANVKYQNHLIYKQIKRINNRCTAAPVHMPSLDRAMSEQARASRRHRHRSAKAKPRACPRNFVYNEENDKCYKFSTDRITWRMSREKCRNIEADLVSVGDVRMQHFISAMARKNKELRHCDFWIGANDMEREGHWRWAGSDKSITYANWNHNEPNNGSGDEHCAMMLWVFNWSWNDARCKYDNACYICETNMNAD